MDGPPRRGIAFALMLLIRRAGTLLLIAVLALGLGAAAAGAKKKHKKIRTWGSSVTLTRSADQQFTGVVGSKLKACRNSRVITVYYTDPNTGQTQPVSVQRTDSKGHYRVDLPTPPYAGGYQAIVDKQRVRAMKAKQTCKGATSTALTV